MKELKKALFYSSIGQLVSWTILTLLDELPYLTISNRESISLFGSIIVGILLIVYYFKYIKKNIKESNLNIFKFNLLLFIFWNLIGYGIAYLMIRLIDLKILHVCGESMFCFLNGIEYVCFFIVFIFVSLVILSINMIIKLINKIKNK